LIDNYHVVEAQIRQIGDDLPPGYYRQLPKLADGPLAGYPRVLGVARAFVAHTDSRFDAQLLPRFVGAYQRVQPLTIGELWAIAITLRIVLVENLRRAADLIASRRAIRQQADRVADRLLGTGTRSAEPIAEVLHELNGVPLTPAFAVQLLQRLRDQDPGATPALVWLEDRLAATGTTADAVVRDEHQRQGASSVTVRNIITSMRTISAVDWADLFEGVSLVDAVLREDSDFGEMDFPTRDRYRAAIEELARGSKLTELEIAHRAVQAASAGASARERDPGDPLIGRGRRALEAAAGYRAGIRTWSARLTAAAGIRGHIAGVGLLAAIILAWPLVALARAGSGTWALGVFAACGFVLAIDAAMALVNGSITSRLGAKVLPALELKEGVPAQLRTLVVVPTILTTRKSLAGNLEQLEIHHLASLDGDLCFALLSDWADATAERGRRCIARRCGRRRRSPEPPVRAGSGGRALPAAASPALVECRPRHLDGVGAQARQAARTESPAARRGRYQLHRDGRPATRCSGRRPLRRHARCRHATTAGCGASPGRQAGASTQCSAVRC
jgi:cyclic beta-1,2-glucan synthetase